MLSINDLKKDTEKKIYYINTNCDLAQSFGVYHNELELELLPYASAVNISCAAHSGDPLTIRNALLYAKNYNVEIGAHIGYPDIQGFGYRTMDLNEEEMEALVLFQIGAISSLAKAYGLKVTHVRPHGALYVKAVNDFQTMLSMAKAIAKTDKWLVLLACECPNLRKAAELAGIKCAGEVFLDKKYKIDGTPDFEAKDIVDIDYSVKVLENLLENQSVVNEEGGLTKVKFESIHLNMKNEISLDIAQTVKNKLERPVPLALSIMEDKSWI
ncbi:MAG: LamB/YcsF family protein [Candidatus Gastranaerophilales bacterium]|nr:LamB/YcsF family protein [Candidatus Gastranaerophilales bacterium]